LTIQLIFKNISTMTGLNKLTQRRICLNKKKENLVLKYKLKICEQAKQHKNYWKTFIIAPKPIKLEHILNHVINIPNEVTHMTFGRKYNQQINITNNVISLLIENCDYNKKLKIGKYLRYLIVGVGFKLPSHIPTSIRTIEKNSQCSMLQFWQTAHKIGYYNKSKYTVFFLDNF